MNINIPENIEELYIRFSSLVINYEPELLLINYKNGKEFSNFLQCNNYGIFMKRLAVVQRIGDSIVKEINDD